MQAIKQKEAAVKRLVNKFTSDSISEEEIEWCLYSIGTYGTGTYFRLFWDMD